MSKSGIFQGIQARLLDPICGLNFNKVGLYNSQYDNDDKEDPYGARSAFIEFKEVEHVTENKGYQKSKYLITIHIGYETYKEVSTKSTSFTDVKALDFFDSVFACLQRFSLSCPDTSPLIRESERQDINHDNIIHWEIDFSFEAQDAQAFVDTGKTVIPAGTVKAVILSDLDIDNDNVRTGDGEF